MLENNQYPPSFYEPIIHQTLKDIIAPMNKPSEDRPNDNSNSTTTSSASASLSTQREVETPKRAIFIQYRGKCTEEFAHSLHKCKAPCSIIMTLRKLKTTLPSLKPPIEKFLRSGVVYEITFARCNVAYVGQTVRHLTYTFLGTSEKDGTSPET